MQTHIHRSSVQYAKSTEERSPGAPFIAFLPHAMSGYSQKRTFFPYPIQHPPTHRDGAAMNGAPKLPSCSPTKQKDTSNGRARVHACRQNPQRMADPERGPSLPHREGPRRRTSALPPQSSPHPSRCSRPCPCLHPKVSSHPSRLYPSNPRSSRCPCTKKTPANRVSSKIILAAPATHPQSAIYRKI